MNDWSDKRVVVMGLGRFGGGVGVTGWLASRGASVVVTDMAGADQLTESLAQLKGVNAEFHLGGHDPADLDNCDLLVVNPAVPDDAPFLQAARRMGVALTTEINLFCQRCPAPIVGITGSVGKSTTAAMTAAVLRRVRTTHLGGNIGRSLLGDLAAGTIAADHVVVLELSSFQLSYTPMVGISPHVALVTNLHANHLDRHGTMAAYAAAKKNIFRFQGADDVLIVPADDADVGPWADEAPGRAVRFDVDGEPFELRVPGRHNQTNAQAAWAIGSELGVPRDAAAAALVEFTGLPHRLALAGEHRGVRFFDDSKATTPAGAIVALRSFDPGRLVAIVGGYDKQVPLDELCRVLADQCKTVVATGQVGGAIAEGVRRCVTAGAAPEVIAAPAFDDAIAAAVHAAAAGDVVLLSPACASFDQFDNYIQRGLRFQELIAG